MTNNRKGPQKGFIASEEYFAERIVNESEMLEGEELFVATNKFIDELFDKCDRKDD